MAFVLLLKEVGFDFWEGEGSFLYFVFMLLMFILGIICKGFDSEDIVFLVKVIYIEINLMYFCKV